MLLSSVILQGQCTIVSATTNLSMVTSSYNTSIPATNGPSGCGDYCGLLCTNTFLIAYGNLDGAVTITTGTNYDQIIVDFGALSNVSGNTEYLEILIDGQFYDLTQGSSSYVNTCGTAFVTTPGNTSYTGKVGVIAASSAAGGGKITINLDCTVNAASSITAQVINVGGSAEGILAQFQFCDTGISLPTCNCDLTDVTLDCDGDGVDNGTEMTNNTNPEDPCVPNPNPNVTGTSDLCAALIAYPALGPCDWDDDGDDNTTECANNTDPYCDQSNAANPTGTCCAAGTAAPIFGGN